MLETNKIGLKQGKVRLNKKFFGLSLIIMLLLLSLAYAVVNANFPLTIVQILSSAWNRGNDTANVCGMNSTNITCINGKITINETFIADMPTCSGTDKLTFDGSTISCAADATGSGGQLVGTDNTYLFNATTGGINIISLNDTKLKEQIDDNISSNNASVNANINALLQAKDDTFNSRNWSNASLLPTSPFFNSFSNKGNNTANVCGMNSTNITCRDGILVINDTFIDTETDPIASTFKINHSEDEIADMGNRSLLNHILNNNNTVTAELNTKNESLTDLSQFADSGNIYQDDIGADCGVNNFAKGVDDNGALDCAVPIDTDTNEEGSWINSSQHTNTTKDVYIKGNLTAGNLSIESGTGFLGWFRHAITAMRVWTFPDKSGTVALLEDVPIYSISINGTNRTDTSKINDIADFNASIRNYVKDNNASINARTYGGEVTGTYTNIVLSNTALDDQYVRDNEINNTDYNFNNIEIINVSIKRTNITFGDGVSNGYTMYWQRKQINSSCIGDYFNTTLLDYYCLS